MPPTPEPASPPCQAPPGYWGDEDPPAPPGGPDESAPAPEPPDGGAGEP